MFAASPNGIQPTKASGADGKIPECALKFAPNFEPIIPLEERIQLAETRVFKAVFPNTTNHYDTLFGGTAMQMMDEIAFITATRFTRKRVVTVSSDKINFNKPIPAGTIVELIGRVAHLGNTSLRIDVDIFVEEMYSDHRERAVHGSFTFVAIDEHKNPVKIL